MNVTFTSATLLPPIIEEDGRERVSKKLGDGVYTLEGYEIRDRLTPKGNGMTSVERSITNLSGSKKTFKSIIEMRTLFKPEQYIFPCLIYNGNRIGKSNTPKGLDYKGEPWVFAYDRLGIPSCTVTEDAGHGFALFASARDRVSLESACSLIRNADGSFTHRIYHPVTEAPVSYTGKDRMTHRCDRYFTLEAGETVTVEVFAFECTPRWKNYAMAELIDALCLEFDLNKTPAESADRVWELGISYIKALLYKYQGRDMIVTHYAPNAYARMSCGLLSDEALAELLSNPENTKLVTHERFELGWADQGMLNSRHLITEALNTGDKELLSKAMGIFDSWIATQKENGLLFPLYEKNFGEWRPEHRTADTCNMGWAIRETVEAYTLLKKHGILREEYLTFAKRLGDFFADNYSEEWGFGKLWSIEGECIDKSGSVGGFVLLGLLYLYNVTEDEKYLNCAKKACDLYYERDLDSFICLAGALDCEAVDKESSYPFIKVSLMLYDATGDALYLERAEKAAYYFTSWMFFYDVITEPDSDFNIHGYHTTGGTAISAEHNAIDAWASIILPDLWRLYEITGNETWLKTARAMWCNSILGIATEEKREFHGQIRPVGSQNEGFFQCRWTKYRPTCEERGHFNDCLSAWCGAFRLYAIEQLKNSKGKKIFE